MSLPYFPLYPTDFEADTSHLTLEEDGAYNRLLRLMWMTPGCSIPDDPEWIQRRMRITESQYLKVVLPIIDEFLCRGNARVWSARLTIEYQKSVNWSKRQSERAAKRWNQREKHDAVAMQELGNAIPEPEPEPDISKNRAREKMLTKEFNDEFWPQWPNKVGKPKALTAYLRARRKADCGEIVDGVRRYIAGKPPDRNWLNPATFLNQERWNDEPATTGATSGGEPELPKWKGPDDDAETQGVLRKGNGFHQGEEGGGLRSLHGDISGNEGVERVGRLLS